MTVADKFMAHYDNCPQCQRRRYCDEGKRLDKLASEAPREVSQENRDKGRVHVSEVMEGIGGEVLETMRQMKAKIRRVEGDNSRLTTELELADNHYRTWQTNAKILRDVLVPLEWISDGFTPNVVICPVCGYHELGDRDRKIHDKDCPLNKALSKIPDPMTVTFGECVSQRLKRMRQRTLSDEPWKEPNDHGELPGGICCQRATGEFCYEHNPMTYQHNTITCPHCGDSHDCEP